MKTKEEILSLLRSLQGIVNSDRLKEITNYIESFNPNRIDEERFMEIYRGTGVTLTHTIEEYNSTCEDHQVLQPLPDEMPEWMKYMLSVGELDKAWKRLTQHYGTPTKKELVSVEELEKELFQIYGNHKLACSPTFPIAKHIVDKYSLHPAKKEFPFNLKEGDLVSWNGVEKYKFKQITLRLIGESGNTLNALLSSCTPYIEPSIHDKFMASLSDEQKKMYEEIKEATK